MKEKKIFKKEVLLQCCHISLIQANKFSTHPTLESEIL